MAPFWREVLNCFGWKVRNLPIYLAAIQYLRSVMSSREDNKKLKIKRTRPNLQTTSSLLWEANALMYGMSTTETVREIYRGKWCRKYIMMQLTENSSLVNIITQLKLIQSSIFLTYIFKTLNFEIFYISRTNSVPELSISRKSRGWGVKGP